MNSGLEEILLTPLWDYWNDNTQLKKHDQYIAEFEQKNENFRNLLDIKRSFLNKNPVDDYLIETTYERYEQYKQVFLYDDFLLKYFKTRSYDDIKY